MSNGDAPREQVERLLGLLAELGQRLENFESGPKEFDTGVPLYRAETHTLQAIGRDPTTNVTRLAEQLGVTKAAISQTLTKLVRKKLVRKRKAKTSRREVALELTPLGWRGYHAHEKFHAEAFAAVREYFNDNFDDRIAATQRALRDVLGVFDAFNRRTQDT